MFTYTGESKSIRAGRNALNKIMSNPDKVRADIIAHGPFDFTSVSPEALAEWFLACYQAHSVEIRVYRAKKNVLARTTGTKSIELNYVTLPRPAASVAGTLAHEFCHVADRLNDKLRFGHGNNSSIGKAHSFPYWIGYYVKQEVKRLQAIAAAEKANVDNLGNPESPQ